MGATSRDCLGMPVLYMVMVGDGNELLLFETETERIGAIPHLY